MSTRSVRILVVEDDAAMREVLQARLQFWGYQVDIAANGSEARDLVAWKDFDLVISEILLPDFSGLELLRCLKLADPHRPVILITVQASVDLAVETMKLGAQDFLTKPLDHAKLKATIESAVKEIKMRRASRRLNTRLSKINVLGEFAVVGRTMCELADLIKILANSDTPVLVTGESGTGKELVARTLHQLSSRAQGPFIAVNTAAIPESLLESELFGVEKGAFTGALTSRPGCFELADQGMLLLDEITEMPLALQPKLLRVLEGGQLRRLGGASEIGFNARIVAATSRNPRQAVEEGSLREDLYFRLNVFTLDLPPLRERKDEIVLLAQHFVREFNQKHGASVVSFRAEVLKKFRSYSWPGNVRELRNVVERAIILARGEWIECCDIPPYILKPVEEESRMTIPFGMTAAEVERELILRSLKNNGNNKAAVARQLGLDVKTVRNKLKAYGAPSRLRG
jgi:DNA-binding NtrC family response regulator